MKVCAAQMPSCAEPERNRAAVASMVERAGALGADLVVLPEAIQHEFGSPGAELARGAERLDGPFVSDLIDLAKRHRLTVTAGMFETTDQNERPFNTTVVISPEGLVGLYRKIHLYDALGFEESKGVSPGPTGEESLCVVDVGDVRVGILTCFDLRFPEMAAALAGKGAAILALGAAWVPGARKEEQWATLLSARAIETACFVVAAAQPSPRYCGHSAIVHPDGHVLRAANGADEVLINEELALDEVASIRAVMPIGDLRRLGREI